MKISSGKIISFTILLILCHAVFPFAVFSRQWPDSSQAVTSSFASAIEDGFAMGMEFETPEERVTAWGSGELIWHSSEEGSSPLADEGMVVVEHSDGFRSYYCGLDVRPELKNNVLEGEWLGYSGLEGWRFVISDFRQGRIVNPLGLLPVRTVENPPRLGLIELSRGGEILTVENGMSIAPGRWSLTVDAVHNNAGNAIPVEISLYWLGTLAGFVKFDSLEETNGFVVLNSSRPMAFDEVYISGGQLVFHDISFNEGRGNLELRIKDEKGNVLSREWNLVVRNPR